MKLLSGRRQVFLCLMALGLSACGGDVSDHQSSSGSQDTGSPDTKAEKNLESVGVGQHMTEEKAPEIFGTDHHFAKESIYFLLTDRFVDGDPANNFEDQGGEVYFTFNRHLPGPDGAHANIGYMGGDFKGVLNNADYISDMGFTSVWMTPILDNPDAAFSGDKEVTYGAGYQDGFKTGYHGYWATNFYKVDEHLESQDLDFKTFVSRMKNEHDLNFILDIVGNHGSPSYTMPEAQPEFGKIYDESGKLVADHQNLHPEDLDYSNPLHRFFRKSTGLAKLSELDPENPEVMDYLVNSYIKWLDQGAYAIRVDTIKEQPHSFWKKVSDRLRAHRPDIFMFGESYSFDANFIAEHTKPENGAYSVLDFPGREAMIKVFENPSSDYSEIKDYLHLESGVYQNPYELVTFFDNHDMSRMNATDEGFINAINWLFTSRGIPAVYYGSEVNFMTGMPEHRGNRNYFGQERVDAAKSHPIRTALKSIANIRKNSVALQSGVQVNLKFEGGTAAFYRVFQKDGVNQTALVLLNKSADAATLNLSDMLNPGTWTAAIGEEVLEVVSGQSSLSIELQPNSVKVFILDEAISNPKLLQRAQTLSYARSPS